MCSRTAMLMASLLLFALPLHAAGEDDEAWIARYMASAGAPGLVRSAAQARVLEFAQLSNHVGQRARFVLTNGRERRGIIEGVRAGEVQLRAQFGGGFFLYSLSRGEIRDIRLD